MNIDYKKVVELFVVLHLSKINQMSLIYEPVRDIVYNTVNRQFFRFISK